MKLILGISGASGFAYAECALEMLKQKHVEVHLIISNAALKTMRIESDSDIEYIRSLAACNYDIDDIGAAVASGSFKTAGMLIAPCSMKTLSAIATGYSDNLLTRAADVVLKERRKLVLMTRESPLHTVHIKNMLTVSEMGGIIAPPSPSFYHNPETLGDIVKFSVGRVLDLFDIDVDIPRWE